MATNAEKLKNLIEQREQLDAKIKEARNAARRDERKARNHALMVIGGLVVKQAPGGDWTRIDWDQLAAWIEQFGYKIAQFEAEELPPDEAYKRLRDWERRGREPEADDANAAAESGAPVAGDDYGGADAAAAGGAYATGNAYSDMDAVEPDGLRWPDSYGGATWGAGARDGDRA